MLEYLMTKYGIRMDIKELSLELKVPEETLKHKGHKYRTELKIYRDGSKTFANTEDVSQYLKRKSEE